MRGFHVFTRYSIGDTYLVDKRLSEPIHVTVFDAENLGENVDIEEFVPIWVGKSEAFGPEARKEAETWLNERYPRYRNPMAYWT